MFSVDNDMTILLTRGDTAVIPVTAVVDEESNYVFQLGDVLRFKVFEKKNCDNVVLEVNFPVEEETELVNLVLTEQHTTIGGIINKPVDYWYEVELNPYTNPQTIVGYDDDGPKIFRLYPEGKEIEPLSPKPEDLKTVDSELDTKSTNPIENQAVARAIINIEEIIENNETKSVKNSEVIDKKITDEINQRSQMQERFETELAVLRGRVNTFTSLPADSTINDAELADARVDFEGNIHKTTGECSRFQAQSNRDLINKKVDFKDDTVNSSVAIEHNSGVINLNVNYPVETNPLLDEIIYEDKTFRDIFITGDMLHSLGSCEYGLPEGTIVGSPELTNEMVNNGKYSIKVFGSASHIRTEVAGVTEGQRLYCAGKVNCTRYEKGNCGIALINLSQLNLSLSKITNGFVTVSGKREVIINPNSGVVKLEIVVGSYSNANLDCYVDDVVMIDLSMFETEPSVEQLNTMYDEYVNRLKGLSYKINTITDEEVETEIYTDAECVSAFMEKVNEKALELGMENSFFSDSSGYDGKSLTTSRDLVKMFISSTSYNELMKIWGKESKVVTTKNAEPTSVTFERNTDYETLRASYYIFGGKTGAWGTNDNVTMNLGVIGEINGKMVAGVVMKCDTLTGRFTAMKELFDIAKQIIENPDIDKSLLRVAHAESACCCIVPEYNVNCYEDYPFNYLFEQNADVQYNPASVTKVISSMVMLDYVKELNETIEFITSDLKGGSGAVFSAGDIITYKDGLFAIMLPSSNMTAECVARNVGEKILRLG